MKTLVRFVALCAVFASGSALPNPAVLTSQPEAAPLSCLPAAKPFFAEAWESIANVHTDEARDLFSQTVAVDPSCALAWAYLGSLTPGPNGRRMVDDAVVSSAAASEPERLHVLALAAQHRGDDEKALTLLRQARDLVPNSYRLNFAVAQRAAVMRLFSDAAGAAIRATEISPERGAAWNVLGYAYVGMKQHPQAVEAFRRYAEAAPLEPNAHDSLGDALLANNQLEPARAAYQRALDSSGGSFWASNDGVATVCAIQRDWFCARAAIEKARHAAPLQDDQLRLMEWTAWSYLSDNQPAEAYRALADLAHDAKRANLELRLAEAEVLKGKFLITEGRHKEALATFTALGKQKLPTLNEGQRLTVNARRLHGVVEAQARLNNLGAAERALGELRTLFDFRPRDVQGMDAVAHSRGLIALQKKDPALAISAFMQCSEAYDACKLNLAEAQLAAGDAPAAARTRAEVRLANHRDPEYWWVRTPSRSNPRTSPV